MPATVLVVEDERKLRELVRSLVDAGAAPKQGACGVGQAGAAAGAGPADRAGGAVDVRSAAGRAQPGPHHEDVIAYLRAREITLIYDPVTGTLQADSPEAVATVIGRAS